MELFMEQAPQTVGNFLDNYARQGAYDNTIFHYVDPKGFILGGGYTADTRFQADPGRDQQRIEERPVARAGDRRHVPAMRKTRTAPTCEFFHQRRRKHGPELPGGRARPARAIASSAAWTQGMGRVVDQRLPLLPTAPKEGFDNLPAEAIVIQSVEEVK